MSLWRGYPNRSTDRYPGRTVSGTSAVLIHLHLTADVGRQIRPVSEGRRESLQSIAEWFYKISRSGRKSLISQTDLSIKSIKGNSEERFHRAPLTYREQSNLLSFPVKAFRGVSDFRVSFRLLIMGNCHFTANRVHANTNLRKSNANFQRTCPTDFCRVNPYPTNNRVRPCV